MERLSLIAPPENMESYNTRSYCTQQKLFERLDTEDKWLAFLARERKTIRWVVPWWRIPRMVCSGSTSEVCVSGLRTRTFYFPTWLLRQYGRRQSIPVDDAVRLDDVPMVGENARRWEQYCLARPKLDILDLGIDGWEVSRHYIRWMTSDNASFKADMRIAERKERTERKSLREYEVEASTSSSARKTSLVRDRLGPKVMPVWERLGPKAEDKRKRMRATGASK